MIRNGTVRLLGFGLLLGVISSTGCSQAPSFDIIGSFFPAWLVCLVVALLLTAAAYWVLLRAHVVLALPVLSYPSLTILFTLALWLAFFR
jgi:YtcA family